MKQTNVLYRLDQLRRRHLRLALWAGAAIGIIVLICGIALCMSVDLVMELAPALRIASAGAVVTACLFALTRPFVRSRALLSRKNLARELDGAGGHAGQILSGSDLAETGGTGPSASALTNALAIMSVERATELADHVPLGKAAPTTPVRRWLLATSTVVGLAVVTALVAPRLVQMQWARLADPFGDHPPFSRVELTVSPGNTSALYGQGVDITVTATEDIESAEMVWEPNGAAAQVLPMFRETTGKWRGTIAEAREAGKYFIRTPVARSYRFDVDVVMVPQITAVRFRITPPAYTRKPTYEGPVPQDGISGLPGTKVEVLASSNRPLAEGALLVSAALPRPTTQPSQKLILSPSAPAASEVRGEFTISESGKLAIQVRDTGGQWSTETFTAQVKMIKDDRPIVRFLQPEGFSMATPSAMLRLQVSSEDDYGVTRMQVYRSLEGSRPRSADLAVPVPTVARVEGTSVINLAELKLQPGNTLELFARAEDNDPAGAKGSETPVIVVKIISEEQMRELEIARAGMETLQAKYQHAERLMESLQQQLAAAEEQIKKTGELSPETKRQLEDTMKAFEQAQQQLEKLQDENLPLALDKELRKELLELRKQVSQAKDALKNADAKTPGSTASSVARASEILKQAKQQYDESAMKPLDAFAKVLALKEDEAKFVDLYNHEKDLASRLAALKNQAAVEDPSTKARMRDLEDEQREVRDDLTALLEQIETHFTELPEDETFAKLRKTAGEFLNRARASGAAETMIDAELALSGFDGQESWSKADEAAKILYGLLSHCNATGDEAGNCPVKFAPSLSGAMGETIEELLGAQGLSSGRSGIGRGGYSAQRNTMRNVGLYGGRPRTSRPTAGRGVSGTGTTLKTQSPSADANSLAPRSSAAGQSNGAPQVPVPAEYRRRVSDYYQRVADELGDNPRRTEREK